MVPVNLLVSFPVLCKTVLTVSIVGVLVQALRLLPNLKHKDSWQAVQCKQVNSVEEENYVASGFCDVVLEEVEEADLEDSENEVGNLCF